MERTRDSSGRSAAELLAILGLSSARAGDIAAARARLLECLGHLHGEGSGVVGAVALHAAAELAIAVGQPLRAVELYGARERILHRIGATPPEPAAERVDGLRAELGEERFQAAWKVCESTPDPLVFYVNAVSHWLEGIGSGTADDPASQDGTLPPGANPVSTFASSTAILVSRAKQGDSSARERLAARYLGALRRFAHGRLPGTARDLMDTNDLVQVSMMRGMKGVERLNVQRKGDFFAYLRRIVLNLVQDEIRRSSRKRRVAQLAGTDLPPVRSPLDHLLEKEAVDLYRSGLTKLQPIHRDALKLRLEQGLSYQEVADALQCPTANAARMLVSRALTQLAKAVRGEA